MGEGSEGARFLRYDEVPYVDQLTVTDGAPPEVVAKATEAAKAGVRRKQVTNGEVGVYTHISEFPAGFEVPLHSHDHDEMIVILEGGCTMTGPDSRGPELAASDVALLKAGLPYGFVAGPDGLRFMNVRQGLAAISLGGAG